ncbi:hypothetical protein HY642_06300 [Candidatus Woesearchaeota archaeon]|nr:hypothetical protein [Candidatus Woesearchaeota archaeon]
MTAAEYIPWLALLAIAIAIVTSSAKIADVAGNRLTAAFAAEKTLTVLNQPRQGEQLQVSMRALNANSTVLFAVTTLTGDLLHVEQGLYAGQRNISLPALTPGKYRLFVSIDQDGSTITATEGFTVLPVHG